MWVCLVPRGRDARHGTSPTAPDPIFSRLFLFLCLPLTLAAHCSFPSIPFPAGKPVLLKSFLCQATRGLLVPAVFCSPSIAVCERGVTRVSSSCLARRPPHPILLPAGSCVSPEKPPLLGPEGNGLPWGEPGYFLKTWEIRMTYCLRDNWRTRETDPLGSQPVKAQMFQIFDLSNNLKGTLLFVGFCLSL